MIELWINHQEEPDLDSDIISNAPCVPRVGATMETSYGIRVVKDLHYDFHATDGSVRVHVVVGHNPRAAANAIKHRTS